ncbi:MAG: sugar ABC transporter substrate-binding protein [Coprothermobacterota bacterium]|nr:sugar ABC transporter substrate-binding protein [Coprothermobacterota bacterium]
MICKLARSFSIGTVFLVCTLLIFSCSAPQTSSPTATQTTPTSTTPPPKEYHFGLNVRDLTAPFVKAIQIGAEKKAKELGIKLTVLSADNDSQRELTNIDNLITMGIDGYINGSSWDPVAIIPGIKKLNDAGIPVVATDNSPTGGKVAYHINLDIADTTIRLTNLFLNEIKKRNGGEMPTGVVIEVLGDLIPESWAGIETKAFHSIIDQYKDKLNVVQCNGNWNNDDTFRGVADYLTRFGDQVVGIFVQTPDVMGTGAVSAIKQAGLDPKKFVTAGICIGPEGLVLLQNDEFFCMTEQPCLAEGEMAVELLYKILTNQPTPKEGDTIVEEGAIWSPAEVVNNTAGAEGLDIKLLSAFCPQEVSPTDPRLYENVVAVSP